MRLPRFLRRRDEPRPEPAAWSPGRVVDLFRGDWIPEGVTVMVAWGRPVDRVDVMAGRPGAGDIEARKFELCACPGCLESGEYEAWAATVKADIAGAFPPDDVAFRTPTARAPAAEPSRN